MRRGFIVLSRILLFLSLWLVAGTSFAQTIAIEGGLPRDLTEGRFRLTITISGLTQALIDRGATDGTGNEQLKSRFAIKLSNLGQNEDLPIDPATAAAATRLTKFYMQEGQPMVQDPADVKNAPDQHSQRYFIDVIEAVPGELKAKASSGSVTVVVYFYLGFATVKDQVAKLDPGKVILQEVYLINAQPTFDGSSPIAGSHKSLIVNWKVSEAVATLGPDTTPRVPSNVVVYVVHPDVASQSFPAKVFSGAAGTADADGFCQYAKPASTAAAGCITCAEKTYLNRTAIKELLGDKVTIVTGKNDAGSAKLDGLDNDSPAPYTVFMQYLPDGIGASQCIPGQPSANFTLTELNGEGDAEVVDFRCFVATAAYGSPMADELKYFRKFRSQVLLKSAVGRWFVHNYYEYSPPVADFIAGRPAVRDFVRGILEVPAKMLKSVDEYY